VQHKNIIIIIPTYNEVKNIKPLIEQLFFLALDLSLLIVDDNSPDLTSQIVENMQSKYPNLYLIKRKCRLGLGTAYIDGFRYALEKGYEVIIQMDADFSHSPYYISEMVNLLNRYDLVIGSRYVRGGRVSDWGLGRVLLSKLANIFCKRCLRLPINDLTSGFKCMRRRVLENIDFGTITSKGYAFQIEMVYRTFLKGFKIIEYPIIFKGRRKEKSKMSLGIVIEAFIRAIFLSFLRFQKAEKFKIVYQNLYQKFVAPATKKGYN
jgi:dolichol-phosphate mannosyltransferase